MNQDNAAVVETEIAPVEAPKAAKKSPAKKGAKKPPAQVDWNSEAALKAIAREFPIGSKVEYTGTRVKAHAGRSGIVTGYRNGNGLVVDFGKAGTGSITRAKAKMLSRGKKGAQAPASEPQAADQA